MWIEVSDKNAFEKELDGLVLVRHGTMYGEGEYWEYATSRTDLPTHRVEQIPLVGRLFLEWH